MHMDLVHIISKSLTRAVRPAEHFLELLESSDEWQKDYRFPKIFPASFSCCKFGKMTPSMCVCVCVWRGGKWTRGWGLIAKVNGVVVKKLEMLFTCPSITNPNKLTSQIKQSMAATPDRFGNPKISTVFPTELCCSVCSHQVQTARFWEQVPSGWT